MAGIRAILGFFPKTSDYEAKRQKLDNEYNELLAFRSSKELHRYNELEEYLNSEEFKGKQKDILSLRYKNTEDFQKEKQYKALAKSGDIKRYLKTANSSELTRFQKLEESDTLKNFRQLEEFVNSDEFVNTKKEASGSKREKFQRSDLAKTLEQYNAQKSKELTNEGEKEAFEDLESFIKSDDFKRQKKEIESKSFKDTEAYQKLQEYNTLRKSDDIRFYQKFGKSKNYKNYLAVKDSEKLEKYEELKEFVKSDAFLRFKEYASMSPRKRWQESKEYETQQEFVALQKSEKIKWYFKNLNSPRFDWHRNWKETFAEDFEAKTLDKKKWITRYYYGEELLKDSYSLSSDRHFVTDGKNVSIDASKLVLTLRKEETKGKSWHPQYGFITRDFGYTAGVVNTGKSFRQRYGTFEAKIKISHTRENINAFWMVGKKQVPHIDIMKANGKLEAGNFWGDSANAKSIKSFKKKYKRSKFQSDYFIYSLEWTPEKLTWKINGLEIASTSAGLPDEPLYMALSSGLQKDVAATELPAMMEVDWIRCFQREDLAAKKA